MYNTTSTSYAGMQGLGSSKSSETTIGMDRTPRKIEEMIKLFQDENHNLAVIFDRLSRLKDRIALALEVDKEGGLKGSISEVQSGHFPVIDSCLKTYSSLNYQINSILDDLENVL